MCVLALRMSLLLKIKVSLSFLLGDGSDGLESGIASSEEVGPRCLLNPNFDVFESALNLGD